MNGLTSHTKNSYVTPNLSALLPDLRDKLDVVKDLQKQEGRFAQPNSQEELAEIVQRELSSAKKTLIGDIQLYQAGCRSVLEKLVGEREHLLDKHMRDNYAGFSKRRFLTLRYNLPDGTQEVVPNIEVDTYMGDQQVLQFISNHRQEALPGKLLNNIDAREGVVVSLVLNKVAYTHNRKRVAEMWSRGKLDGNQQILKKGLYVVGVRDDLANDDIGTKLTFDKIGDWYTAMKQQRKAIAGHDLSKSIDIKGRLRNGEKLPVEYDRDLLLDAQKNALELQEFYSRNPNQEISDLHKDQMMLMWTFDHKHMNFPVESQYLLRTAYDIMETPSGVLYHGRYEQDRLRKAGRDAAEQGVHLVLPKINASIANIFKTRELNLSKMPEPNR
jgi:hypothetical protein